MENKKLKEEFIQLFLEGKSIAEISKLTGWSRKYITNLIKNDNRIIEKENTKILKVSKQKEGKQLVTYIPSKFLENIGISRNKNEIEYVKVTQDLKNKTIIIKKA